MFKTELHCHSSEISECARVDSNDVINKFYSAGYSTLVLSNHFNSGTMKYNKSESWDDFITKYVGAYKKLKELAAGKMNILLGMELRFNCNVNDYLVFGVTEKFLRAHPEMLDMNPEGFHKLAKENGCLFVQAHPFRNSMTVVRPDALDGVEVFNGHMGHDSRNEIADLWAEKYGLIKTSGTDFHYNDSPANAGIVTEKEILSMDELVEVLKSGEYQLIRETK